MASLDKYADHTGGTQDRFSTISARNAVAVTPSDSVDLDVPCRALYIGVSGDVSVEMLEDGSAIVHKNAMVGILPIMVTRVNATGTTATDIISYY